jgi:hypothetical protein
MHRLARERVGPHPCEASDCPLSGS